jgi:hypothetical protein
MGDWNSAWRLPNCLLPYCFERVLRAGPPVIGGTTFTSTGEATVIGLKYRF